MAAGSRDRVTVDLRGAGSVVQAKATAQGLTVATTPFLRFCEEVGGIARGPVRALLLPTQSDTANRMARQVEDSRTCAFAA